MMRTLRFLARRLAAAMFTRPRDDHARRSSIFWALPTSPASFVYPASSASDPVRTPAWRTTCSASTGRRSCSTATTSTICSAGDFGRRGRADSRSRTSPSSKPVPDRGTARPAARRDALDHPRRGGVRAVARRAARGAGRQPSRNDQRPHRLARRADRGLLTPDGARHPHPRLLPRTPPLATTRRLLPDLPHGQPGATGRRIGRRIWLCRGSPSRCSFSRCTRA